MKPPRLIGHDRLTAIDWTQETLRITRPLAEDVLRNAIDENVLVETKQGLMLFEDDDEYENRKRSVQHRKSRNSYIRRKVSIQRNKSIREVERRAMSKYSSEATQMMVVQEMQKAGIDPFADEEK